MGQSQSLDSQILWPDWPGSQLTPLTQFPLRDRRVASKQQRALRVCLRVCTGAPAAVPPPNLPRARAAKPVFAAEDSAAVSSGAGQSLLLTGLWKVPAAASSLVPPMGQTHLSDPLSKEPSSDLN